MNEEEKLEFEDQEEEQLIEILPKERRVYSDKPDRSIFELYRQYQKGNLNLRPAFQRLDVWDNSKCSRLIESVLLEVPIPVIYLSEEPDTKYSVIDGQQRLNSFIKFLENNLKLSGLTILTELTGKCFQDIPKNLQDKFENSTIRIIEIRKESHPDVKFEIFERLNTGSVQLNPQELRNCIYRGRYNDLLEELTEDKDFQFLLGLKGPHYRMYDRELILRFFAFYRNTHLNYNPSMKRFLNIEMKDHQNIDEEEEKKLRKIFRKSVRLSKTVFGDRSFRRFIQGSNKDPNGKWETNKINKALFDVVMYGFTRYEENQVVPNSDSIREALINLVTHDRDFLDTISTYTDNKDKIQIRFDRWLSALKEIVGNSKTEPRNFSLQYKKQMWESNPTCAICGQKIHVIDDAEIDHIEQYWRGGKTIPANAQLTHRFCNRSRPLNSPSGVIGKEHPEPPQKPPKTPGPKRSLGRKGYGQLTDYLIPTIRLIKSGIKHTDAFHRIAKELDVTYQTANAQCTVRLGNISTEQFVDLIKSNKIKSFLKERFPDKASLIEQNL
ncbi:MAG: DUF262 domain-containing protein [Thermodesulfobacteriota bacterium]|jgi:hypothetical protein